MIEHLADALGWHHVLEALPRAWTRRLSRTWDRLTVDRSKMPHRCGGCGRPTLSPPLVVDADGKLARREPECSTCAIWGAPE